MNNKTVSILALLSTLAFSNASAAPLYSDSFDYGNTTDNIQNVSNWETSSGVLMYDHDGGLNHSQMNQESGGAFHHDFNSGSRLIDNTTDLSFDLFTGASAGDTWWMSALVQWDGTTGDPGQTRVMIDGDQTVNGFGFGIQSDGTVFLQASDNGGTDAAHNTSATATSGTTHLFLLKATFGSGSSSDRQSTIDFWFDPADTSSEGALGAATFSTGPDSKFGRDGVYTSISVTTQAGSRADEIRFGETLTDAIAIPEPGTLALVGIALGGLLLFRRRRT